MGPGGGVPFFFWLTVIILWYCMRKMTNKDIDFPFLWLGRGEFNLPGGGGGVWDYISLPFFHLL